MKLIYRFSFCIRNVLGLKLNRNRRLYNSFSMKMPALTRFGALLSFAVV
jgi:hypothetical protein